MKATCGHPLYWHNCYVSRFDLIAPESYAHPAKMAGRLCYRILEHLKELGLLKDSDTILDPMAGTGITNICAGALGYKSVSVELEEKFIGFEKQNKDYASRRLYKELDWQIIQGDARKLSELLSERGVVTVSSPPYSHPMTFDGQSKRDKILNGKKLGKRDDVYFSEGNKAWQGLEAGYGTTPGQIGNLKDKPLKAVMSPPYSETTHHIDNPSDLEALMPGRSARLAGTAGESAGNIGHLSYKPLKAITSPPYGDSLNEKKNTTSNLKREERLITAGHQPEEFMGYC